MGASSDNDNYTNVGGPATDKDTGTEALNRAHLFELLSNQRRRFVVHYLKRYSEERIDMGELSTQIAAWEQGVAPDALSYDERKTVHTALYQHHAPKMDEAGVVEYDASRGKIALTSAGEDVDLYLETVGDREISWATYFAALSIVGVLIGLGVFLRVEPLSSIPGALWCLAVSVGFLVSSLVFVCDARQDMRLDGEGPPPEVSEGYDAGDSP